MSNSVRDAAATRLCLIQPKSLFEGELTESELNDKVSDSASVKVILKIGIKL